MRLLSAFAAPAACPRGPGSGGDRHILGVRFGMARKARESGVGQAIGPATNGDSQALLTDIGPVPEARVNSPFPPIAEYAFLSDCEVNCLVAPSGRVEWMCLPRADSPSVFAATLDRAAGSLRLGPPRIM